MTKLLLIAAVGLVGCCNCKEKWDAQIEVNSNAVETLRNPEENWEARVKMAGANGRLKAWEELKP